jgi:hypothetical protein
MTKVQPLKEFTKMPTSTFVASYLYICGIEMKRDLMDDILKKLRYGDQDRIAILNAPEDFRQRVIKLRPGIQIDTEINARYLYTFIIAFTPRSEEVSKMGPACIHNLSIDGKLWMAYPKGSSKRYTSDINRDHGWDQIKESGFRAVSQIAIDEDWSALRFRNAKFVKTSKDVKG